MKRRLFNILFACGLITVVIIIVIGFGIWSKQIDSDKFFDKNKYQNYLLTEKYCYRNDNETNGTYVILKLGGCICQCPSPNRYQCFAIHIYNNYTGDSENITVAECSNIVPTDIDAFLTNRNSFHDTNWKNGVYVILLLGSMLLCVAVALALRFNEWMKDRENGISYDTYKMDDRIVFVNID